MDYRQRYAILNNYKKAILKIYPNTPTGCGIYILKRVTKEDTKIYVGQSVNILERIASHLMTKNKSLHIDASLASYGLKSLLNSKGWELKSIEKPRSELDKVETEYIDKYLKQDNYDVYNVTGGGQGKGKKQIAEFKPRKGYAKGLEQGRKKALKEVGYILDRYFDIVAKKDNKLTENARVKLNKLLGG